MLIEDKYSPIAVTVLRIALGTMFIAHSLYLKLVVFTLQGTVSVFRITRLTVVFCLFHFRY